MYERLSGCLECNIDWYIIECGYKIGKLLLEQSKTTEDIINVCKKCFEKCADWYDRVCYVQDNDKLSEEEIKIYNTIKSEIEQLQSSTIEQIRNIHK